ncbi:MAG: enoyl-CoA hydratase/isomerase family protein [Gammaproteobacteria bacterium]|nr:enoyl-CoA hydratase/isomerase family protein [Gammaproteobacteria bacterium]
MKHVDYALEGNVAVLAFANPPVNSLGFALRRDLVEGLERAIADPAAKAIVLIGAKGTFSAGADIKEFVTGEIARAPSLWHMITAIEMSPKPVVAAIEGLALGGGLELALACHFRVAHKDAKVGLPEVKLGLLPGAGGTQRLPRIIGVEGALNVMLGGTPLPIALFAKSPLFDRVADADLRAAAVAFASEAAAKGELPLIRNIRIREPNIEALCQFARNTARTAFAKYPAPLAIVECVYAAATKKFDDGMAEEAKQFRALVEGPESAALRHIFFGERAANRIADVPDDTPLRDIRSVAVIGGGMMGTGIAICCLNAGLPTHLLEVSQDALDRGVARVRENYEGQVKKGKMKPDKAAERVALLKPTLSYDDIGGDDIVIEAVFEDMGVKEQVFRKLDQVMKPGAILATNTSMLDINHIAAFTRRPADVIGTHFFSPAQVMKLLEVVRGAKTAKDVLATTMKLAKALKKTAVVSGVCDGFIGNRMIEQYSRQAMFLLEEGASVQQVDAAVEKFGFMMGPFRMSDLAGNDIGAHIRKRRYVETPSVIYSKVADKLCDLGRFGQKTSAGWYDYKPGDRTAYPSSVVDELVAAHRASIGVKTRKIDDREIVDRLVYALVNEGAAILEEGIAQRASDIDMVYLMGYGFPIYRGGPMLYADTVGLYAVVQRMRQFAANPHGDPAAWKPSPLLARLAAAGGTFNANTGGAA